MVSIDDYIEQLTAGQESDDLEFKTAKGGFPGSFWETYSAFANTNGGTIILGVVENASGLILQGIDDSMVEKYKKELWSTVNNRNKISVNILTNNDVQDFAVQIQNMEHTNAIMKETINAQPMKYAECMLMQHQF